MYIEEIPQVSGILVADKQLYYVSYTEVYDKLDDLHPGPITTESSPLESVLQQSG